MVKIEFRCSQCLASSLGKLFYYDQKYGHICNRCYHRVPGSPPQSLSHREQVDQRMIKTAAALTQADHLLRTRQLALEMAQKAQADALQRYQHLCRQMAEAATAWAILREKGENS